MQALWTKPGSSRKGQAFLALAALALIGLPQEVLARELIGEAQSVTSAPTSMMDEGEGTSSSQIITSNGETIGQTSSPLLEDTSLMGQLPNPIPIVFKYDSSLTSLAPTLKGNLAAHFFFSSVTSLPAMSIPPNTPLTLPGTQFDEPLSNANVMVTLDTPVTVGQGTHTNLISLMGSGDFFGTIGGREGTIVVTADKVEVIGSAVVIDTGGNFLLKASSDFIDLSSASDVTLTLQFVLPGSAPGFSTSPTGFVNGFATTNFHGTFSGTNPGGPLAPLPSATGVVPEPSSLVSAVLGALLLLGLPLKRSVCKRT
jgi:hypothetical protein